MENIIEKAVGNKMKSVVSVEVRVDKTRGKEKEWKKVEGDVVKIMNEKLSASVRNCGVQFKIWLIEMQLIFIRRDMIMPGYNIEILLRNL